MASNRFLMVPVDSSAARMPLPDAVMASATLLRSARFIACSLMPVVDDPETIFGAVGCAAMGLSELFLPQDLDAGQGLALHPLQESAAGGGNIGKLVSDPCGIKRRHSVATACHRNELAGLGAGRGVLGE